MDKRLLWAAVALVIALQTGLVDAVCSANPTPADVGLSNGQLPASCNSLQDGATCSPVCDTGYTSYPDPVLTCNAGSLTLSANCAFTCVGAPPSTANVNWLGISSAGTLDTSVVCDNRIPDGQASVFCQGACSNGGYGTPKASCVSGSWVVTGDSCPTTACLSSSLPALTGTSWPSSCDALTPGQNCTGTCIQTSSSLGYGTGALDFPTITCVADTSPSGASFSQATLTGQCIKVCKLPATVWIRNGTWPERCTMVDGKGGLGVDEWCIGQCIPGFYGSPRFICNTAVPEIPGGPIRVPYKRNRTGDCFNGTTGGCWGPVTAPTPLNAAPWDLSKCWDMRVGWNCTTTCNGDWTVTPTDPAAVGYGTGDASTPLPTIRCTYDSSSPYNGSYQPPIGQCVPVCRGPLPSLPDVSWPSTCLPVSGGLGGIPNNNSFCEGICLNGKVGPVRIPCTNKGWGAVVGGCNDPLVTPTTCAGAPKAPTPANALAWPLSCSNSAVSTNCATTCNPTVASGGGWGTAELTYTPFTPCGADGTWSTTSTGQCTRVCAAALPSLGATGDWDPACTVQTGGVGGKRPGQVCVGTCKAGYIGVPKTTCTQSGSGLSWSALTGAASSGCIVPDATRTGVCLGTPAPTPAAANIKPWSCSDYWTGMTCTATCNTGFASADAPTPPTVSCVANEAVPSKGSWSTTATGKCVRVCAAPPATTGVTWNADCTPVNSVGGKATIGAWCFGTCASGYVASPVGAVPKIQCGSTWTGLVNPCVLAGGRRMKS